jgi:uncharacterized protein with HEPN domain
MQRDVRAYLWDIDQAAQSIERFIDRLDIEAYARNEIVHAAVERKFEIIGESLSQLAKRDSALAARIPRTREIIAFRNLLIHGYALIEHARVWRIAHESLPALHGVVVKLINELNGSNA